MLTGRPFQQTAVLMVSATRIPHFKRVAYHLQTMVTRDAECGLLRTTIASALTSTTLVVDGMRFRLAS